MKHLFPPLRVLQAGLRDGSITSATLIEHAIENHRGTDRSHDAYIHFDEGAARRQATDADEALACGDEHGPLHGIPISVKDLFGVTGVPTYAGSSHRLPGEWETEGGIVSALRDQHAVIMGKTHTVEFAFGGLGYNPHWPTPRNPHDEITHRVPGGSSSGAGVSIACGSAIIAFGTDTAGSVRIPASMTGCVGLQTTHGRWPTDGIVPLSPSLDTVGIVARTVDDATRAFHAIDTRGPPAPSVDVGDLSLSRLDGVVWEKCSPGVSETTHSAIAALLRAGARITEHTFEPLDVLLDLFYSGGLAAPEFREFIRVSLPEWRVRIDPFVWQRVDAAGELTRAEYRERVALLEKWRVAAAESFRDVDAWLTPTVAITPPTVESIHDLCAYRTANLLALRNTAVANFLNLCAVTIPAGRDDAGLPVGLQLMAPPDRDAELLAMAQTVESIVGG